MPVRILTQGNGRIYAKCLGRERGHNRLEAAVARCRLSCHQAFLSGTASTLLVATARHLVGQTRVVVAIILVEPGSARVETAARFPR